MTALHPTARFSILRLGRILEQPFDPEIIKTTDRNTL